MKRAFAHDDRQAIVERGQGDARRQRWNLHRGSPGGKVGVTHAIKSDRRKPWRPSLKVEIVLSWLIYVGQKGYGEISFGQSNLAGVFPLRLERGEELQETCLISGFPAASTS